MYGTLHTSKKKEIVEGLTCFHWCIMCSLRSITCLNLFFKRLCILSPMLLDL